MDGLDGWMHERIDRCLDVWMDVTFAARLTSCLPLPFGSHREDREDNEDDENDDEAEDEEDENGRMDG